jgi:ribosomal protein S18 acetylase RimI-like enzyme
VTAFAIRPATLADVPVLTETVRQGFESYRAFMPAGWSPPPERFERSRIEERLPLEHAWCMLAYDREEPAGHVAILAAREQGTDGTLIPGLAHLWMLFVRQPWWGSGLAQRLLALAVSEAADRGFESMRLVTPADQARARAFYEREGFVSDGIVTCEPMLGLGLVEYRRAL